jgi:hypothetical protein
MMRSRKDATKREEESKIGKAGKGGHNAQDIGLVVFDIPGRLKVVKDEESRVRIIFKYYPNVSQSVVRYRGHLERLC